MIRDTLAHFWGTVSGSRRRAEEAEAKRRAEAEAKRRAEQAAATGMPTVKLDPDRQSARLVFFINARTEENAKRIQEAIWKTIWDKYQKLRPGILKNMETPWWNPTLLALMVILNVKCRNAAEAQRIDRELERLFSAEVQAKERAEAEWRQAIISTTDPAALANMVRMACESGPNFSPDVATMALNKINDQTSIYDLCVTTLKDTILTRMPELKDALNTAISTKITDQNILAKIIHFGRTHDACVYPALSRITDQNILCELITDSKNANAHRSLQPRI